MCLMARHLFFFFCFVCAALQQNQYTYLSVLTGFVCFRKTAHVTGCLEPEKSHYGGGARSVRRPARQALQSRLMV